MRLRICLPFAALLAVTGIVFGQSGRGGRQDAAQAPPSLEELPIIGIANVTFKVTELDKARDYYQKILGFAEAFDLKDHSGEVVSAYFKVNDDQYIEIIPTLKPGDLNREERVVFQSTDLGELHALYESRGLNPSNIKKGLDGNPSFRVVSPEGNNLDFLQYAEGSEQAKARGQFLSPDCISTHLWHAGVMTKDTATSGRFYREKLGFTNLRFGTRGEYLETPGRDSNTETKPPLADTPATHFQYENEQWGAVNHIGIEVADMRAARDLLQKRGNFDDQRVRAHVGNNRHWLMFLFDPAGTRTEIVETAIQQDLPPMTVMAPGALAPPILPTTPGALPWPSSSQGGR
jgi:lactoylglutathione lyase